MKKVSNQSLSIISVSIVSFLVIATSCRSCSERNRGGDVTVPVAKTSGKFQRDVPTYRAEEDFGGITEPVSDLKFQKLDSGVSDLQIRIWIGHSMAIKQHVLTIKKTNLGWYSDLDEYTQTTEPGTSENRRHKITESKNDLFPKSGWESFIRTINEFRVFEILQYGDVQEHIGCGGADGMIYVFEFASPDRYRLHYHCELPETFRQFALLLEKEFDVKLFQ